MAIIRVKTDYLTIQEAINAALPGDIILVEDGIYNEELNINKSFIKIAGSGEGTVIDGNMKLNVGVNFNNVRGVELKNLVIKNFRSDGIDFSGSSSNNEIKKIKKVKICDINYFGIWLNSYSSNNEITECEISGSYYGIYNYSNNLIISRFLAVYNGYTGIYCSGNSANTVIKNGIVRNNFSVGVILNGLSATVIENKIIQNRNYGIISYSSCLIKENEVCKNGSDGITIGYSNNVVEMNKVESNGRNGIYISTGYNSIVRNIVNSNKESGIVIDSTDNIVLGNKAVDNGQYDIVRTRAANIIKDNICNNSLPPCLCREHGCSSAETDNYSKEQSVNEEEYS